MAELVLKIGDGANYEDRDVLAAFNRRRIRCCHAEMICRPRLGGIKLGGSTAPLLRAMLKNLSVATVEALWDEIERLTTLRRVDYDRWPMGVEDLKSHFAIAVDEFDDAVAESLVAPLRDSQDVAAIQIDTIKAATAEHEGIYRLTVDKVLGTIVWAETITLGGAEYNLSAESTTTYLVSTKDTLSIGPATIAGIVKKRKQHVAWRDLPGLSAGTLSDISDPSVSVDIRGAATFVRGNVLKTKTAIVVG